MKTKLNKQIADTQSFFEDVIQIAKYLLWRSEVGNKKAQELIDEIHKGKYGSREGLWVQADKHLERLESYLRSVKKEDK